MTVRGIPLATGGSKFMQIHEDGLPVQEFGDVNFGNADQYGPGGLQSGSR